MFEWTVYGSIIETQELALLVVAELFVPVLDDMVDRLRFGVCVDRLSQYVLAAIGRHVVAQVVIGPPARTRRWNGTMPRLAWCLVILAVLG